jgi:hypothetical protein
MPDEAVDGILLVSENCAVSFDCDHQIEGHNSAYLFPAFHDGEKAWLFRKVWSSADGYDCDGLTNESVALYHTGLAIYAEHALFFGDE